MFTWEKYAPEQQSQSVHKNKFDMDHRPEC